MNNEQENSIDSIELDNAAIKISLKNEFIPPPYKFNPPPAVIDYYIVDEKDHTIFNRLDSLESARDEVKRLLVTKKDMAPLILEFDGQVIRDSEKMNIKYLNKILNHKKGPDMEVVMALAGMLKTYNEMQKK